MSTRNPVDPQNPRAIADTLSPAKKRRQRRLNGARTTSKCSEPGKDQKSVVASVLTAVAKFDGKSKVTTRATECIEYKGYTLKIEPQRLGWKVAIFPKGSTFALHSVPYTTKVAGRDDVVEQAKVIVDEATADKTLHMVAIEPAESSESISLTPAALFLRFRRSILQGWTSLRRAYFSIDRPPRISS